MRIDRIKVTYGQDCDACSSYDFHGLRVDIIDGGGGHYIVVRTRRWAFEDAAEIRAFADDVEALLQKVAASQARLRKEIE